MKPDNKKLFVNICTTDAIPCPRDLSEDELIEILNSEDPSNFRVPMSLGEGRTEKDKSGSSVTVYDVAIHPDFFIKIGKKPLFRTFLLTVVFEGLQDKYQLELEMMNYIILKHKKCLGTLQTHRIQQRDILRAQAQDNFKPTLIEELDDGRKTEIVYRLRREPPTGEINYLLAEFKVPASVSFFLFIWSSPTKIEICKQFEMLSRDFLDCSYPLPLNQILDNPMCAPIEIMSRNYLWTVFILNHTTYLLVSH